MRHVPGVEATYNGVQERPGGVAPPDGLFACATCGAILSGDPDEDSTGDAGLPICGECDRSRNFDLDLQQMDEDDQP